MNNEAKLKEVSQEEFYKVIGPQNVAPSIQPGPWPYTSIFKTPHGKERGKVVGYLPDRSALEAKRYYLPTSETI